MAPTVTVQMIYRLEQYMDRILDTKSLAQAIPMHFPRLRYCVVPEKDRKIVMFYMKSKTGQVILIQGL